MKQKTIWLLFLVIGISSIVFNCGKKQIEYRLETDFSYVNKTDKALSFEAFDDSGNKVTINLKPNSSSKIYTINAEGGFENPNPEDCCQGILEGFLEGSDQKSIVVKKNDTTCIIEEPAVISNYNYETIANRHYKYTFTFTNKVLENCK